MQFESFKTNLFNIFSKNSCLPMVDNEKAEKLYALTEIMLEVNKSMNLTAITEESAVILKHYADSLTVSSLIPQGVSVIDVGCGAGFPTLPLGIFRPDLKILALDGTAKRIEYVRSTAKKLGLDNIEAISGRAEELAQRNEYREHFDIVTARAVASLPVLSELCIPFCKVGGYFIAMKASSAGDELGASQNAIKLCGGKVEESISIGLTADDQVFEQRNLIKILKKQPTPKLYPRHYSKISKKPL